MSKRRRSNRRLSVENLECRTLMSATPFSTEISAADTHNLVAAAAPAGIAVPAGEFQGLSSAESSQLRALAARGNVNYQRATTPPPAFKDGSGNLIIHGCAGDDNVVVQNLTGKAGAALVVHKLGTSRNPVRPPQSFSGVKSIIFVGYDGNNTFTNSTSGRVALPVQAIGGAGNDTFKGNDNNDVFFGLGGSDTLTGGFGSDKLYGGTGKDALNAGPNSNGEMATTNVLKGGKGADRLEGGAGLDHLYGDDGDDWLRDDPGNGILWGGAGNDALYGHDKLGTRAGQRLEMHGGAGVDKLFVRRHLQRTYQPCSGDDYYDDAVYATRTTLLASLDTAFANVASWRS